MLVVFQSCEKKGVIENNEELQAEKLTIADMPEIEVKNGMLSFDSKEDFFKTISIIPNMTDEELDAWENKLGFISVRKKQNEFYQKLESYNTETVTEDDIQNLVNEYSDYFEIVQDENGEDEVSYIIDNPIYASIANSSLMYQTSDTVNKVLKNRILMTNISHISDLNKPKNNKNISEFTYTNTYNKSSSQEKNADYIRNESGCNRDRKVKIKMKTYMYAYNPGYGGVYQYVWDVSVLVRGYRRYGCGAWINYKDPLDYKNVHGVIYVEYDTESFSIPAKSLYGRKLYGHKSFTRNSGQGYYGFKKAHGEASSRGVGNNWAIINYGY